MADDDIRLRVSTEDDASEVLDDIAAQGEDLEDHPIEVEVDADTRDARSSLDDLEGSAKDIADQDWIVQFRADADTAKRQAGELEDQLRRTGAAGADAGDKVQSVGGSQRVNAIRDLTGPLGDVSSKVGDFGESFVAAGETIGQQIGLGEKAIGRLAGVLGVGGIAFGAVLSFWQMFKREAEAARKAAREVQEAVAAGEFTAASRKIIEAYGKQIDAATRFGVTQADAVAFITGAADALGRYGGELNGTIDATVRRNELMAENADLSEAEATAIANTVLELSKVRRGYDDAGDSLTNLQRRQFEVTKAIGGTTSALLEQARVAVPAVREEILRYVAAQEGIPDRKITTIITDLDPDDAAQVEKEIDRIARPRTVPVTLQGVTIGVPTGPGARPGSTSTTNVTVNMPRGVSAHAATVRATNRWARRNGGRTMRR